MYIHVIRPITRVGKKTDDSKNVCYEPPPLKKPTRTLKTYIDKNINTNTKDASASDDELVILSTSIQYFYKRLQESVLFHLNMFYFIFFSFPHAVTH